MKNVYVPRTGEEKALQRALLQYSRPGNRNKVKDALKEAGREDLIGFGNKALIRPDSKTNAPSRHKKNRRKGRK